jgi:aryl-alcohol dehydrogenase-like predicted oxidoreductase
MLGSKNNKYSELEQIKKIIKIVELGINKVDTADSYASTNSEKVLSKILAIKPDLLVTTKIGGYISKLPRPFNEILVENKIYQKYNIIKNRGYFDFDPSIRPRELEKRLISSLRRLRVESINCYLLHGVPKENLLDDFFECMLTLKRKGLTSNIGISIDRETNLDLSWCDEILIPANLINYYYSVASRISIHGLFRNDTQFLNSYAKEFLKSPAAESIILGSYDSNKFIRSEMMLQNLIGRS